MGRTASLLQWLTLGLVALGLVGLAPGLLLSWLVIGLAVLTALKLREARSIDERRLVALLQLVCIGLLATLVPDLGPSLLQALATVLALAGLLALELGEGPGWRVLLRRSAQVLAAALPMALVLFLLLPRLSPFTDAPWARGQGAVTGLSDSLEPGSIASLASSRAPAARVTFPGGAPPPPADRYWRVLVHDRFDGRSWTGETTDWRRENGPPPEPFPPAPPPPGTPTELWLDEPSGLAAVPWSGRGRPLTPELRPAATGEMRHRGSAAQRRLYAFAAPAPGAVPWQRVPPTLRDLELPRGRNPRLEALAEGWARLGPPERRLAAAEQLFRRGGFRYTRAPGTLPERAPLDTFLFERRIGFCGHYASAFTALMRGAGVPARVVSGYLGGAWVEPVSGDGYLDLRQEQAHAWSEVWLADRGWVRVDPSSWIGGTAAVTGTTAAVQSQGSGPFTWLQRQWWGLDLAWSRWWLGFDRSDQEALLRRWFGDALPWLGVILLVAVAACLAVGLGLLRLLQRRSAPDPWRRELEAFLALLARRDLVPHTGETLPRFTARVAERWPDLSGELQGFVALYQRLRFGPPPADPPARLLAGRDLRARRRRLEARLRGRSAP